MLLGRFDLASSVHSKAGELNMGSISKRKIVTAVAVALPAMLFASVAEAGGKRDRGRCAQSHCYYAPQCCYAPSPCFTTPACHFKATTHLPAPGTPGYSQPDPVKQNVYVGLTLPTQIVISNFTCNNSEGTPFEPRSAELMFRLNSPTGQHVGTLPSTTTISYNSATRVLVVNGIINASNTPADGIAGIGVTVVGDDPNTQNKSDWKPEKVSFHNHLP